MKFKTVPCLIKTIKSGDPDFMINDGMYIIPRAGFEISRECPEHYRNLIMECLHYGWIKPVAHLTQQEYFMEKLAE